MPDSDWLDVRCPHCDKLLLRLHGFGCILDLLCPRCETASRWPTLAAEIVVRVKETKPLRPVTVGLG